jgi:glycopeptide antibiotics resistance protein
MGTHGISITFFTLYNTSLVTIKLFFLFPFSSANSYENQNQLLFEPKKIEIHFKIFKKTLKLFLDTHASSG